MKKIILILLLFPIMATGQDMSAFKIFDKSGKEVKYSDMVKELADAEFVFFGELHNNPIAHWLEYKLSSGLYKLKKDKLILGAEMFEADNQLILDEYLNGLIVEKRFNSEMRLWPNYSTDYKPLIKFAKENKIDFIASNVPRRYANVVYKKDFNGLKNISDEAKKYIAPLPIKWDASVGCYRQMIEGMKGMGNSGGTTIAKAQALKDATMAHFILKNYDAGKLFLHFNGAYHSDNHEGICWYLSQHEPNAKIKTISTVLQSDISVLDKENKNIADFIICIPEDMNTTY